MFKKLKLMWSRRKRVERLITLLEKVSCYCPNDVEDTYDIIEEYDLSNDVVAIMWYSPSSGYSVSGYSFYNHQDILALEDELNELIKEIE